MKTLVANVLIGVIAYYWFRHVGREAFVANAPFGVALLAVGVAIGIWCAQPNRSKRSPQSRGRKSPPVAELANSFDQLTE